MTAIVSPQPSQGATTPISPSSLSSSSSPSSTSTTTPTSAQPNLPQSQSVLSAEPQPASDASAATATKSNPHYLTSPTTTRPSSEQNNSKPQSRSRESASRRQSYLSTRTTSTRPASSVFPTFVSSLSYALVRDFAYPSFHPLHYGPSAYEPTHSESEASSPSYNAGYGGTFSLDRRLSDPPPSWEGNRGMWSAGPWGGDGGAVFGIEGGGAVGDQLPSTSFGYDSDDPEGGGGSSGIGAGKLTKNHRKSRSFASGEEVTSTNRRRKSEMGGISKKKEQKKDMSHLGTGLDSQGFFQPGATNDDEEEHQRHDEEEGDLPRGSYFTQSTSGEPEDYQNEHHHDDGSLDESFAGPSLALYTFQPENANELALREGQIIQVGYRHGQGWLVAMDLETGEQGLVPEEYVRLLRDIEGWGEEEVEEGEEEEDEPEDETDQKQGNDGSSARRDKRAITVTTETRTETNNGDEEVKVADIEPALGKKEG